MLEISFALFAVRAADKQESQIVANISLPYQQTCPADVDQYMMRRPFRTINEVLDELQVPKDMRFPLQKATRQLVIKYRQKKPVQMQQYLKEKPFFLALEFLTKHGGLIFADGKLKWNGPSDIGMICDRLAEIMCRQNVAREEKHPTRNKNRKKNRNILVQKSTQGRNAESARRNSSKCVMRPRSRMFLTA